MRSVHIVVLLSLCTLQHVQVRDFMYTKFYYQNVVKMNTLFAYNVNEHLFLYLYVLLYCVHVSTVPIWYCMHLVYCVHV